MHKIKHHSRVQFSILDKIKILFGLKMTVTVELYYKGDDIITIVNHNSSFVIHREYVSDDEETEIYFRGGENDNNNPVTD